MTIMTMIVNTITVIRIMRAADTKFHDLVIMSFTRMTITTIMIIIIVNTIMMMIRRGDDQNDCGSPSSPIDHLKFFTAAVLRHFRKRRSCNDP